MHTMAHPVTQVAPISLVQAIFEIHCVWKAAHAALAALAKGSLEALKYSPCDLPNLEPGKVNHTVKLLLSKELVYCLAMWLC